MLKNSAQSYDSAFEEEEICKHKVDRKELYKKEKPGKSDRSATASYEKNEEKRQFRFMLSSQTAYDRHKLLINQYFLYHPGASKLLQRDTSKDKRDFDVIRENHQFLWNDQDEVDTWGKHLAKKYYDKLFKEYCICDLSRYKSNQIGMRWRTEIEVIDGKGQFNCSEKRCQVDEGIRTWEMNFAYIEKGTKKNSLVKLRLCHDCSYKLNYHHKRREVTRRKKRHRVESEKDRSRKHRRRENKEEEQDQVTGEGKDSSGKANQSSEEDIWKGPVKIDEKSRDDEFEEYLEELFL